MRTRRFSEVAARTAAALGVGLVLLQATGCHRAALKPPSRPQASAGLRQGEQAPERRISELRALLRQRPRDRSLHQELAGLLEERGDMQGCIAELRTLASLAPRDFTTYYALAEAYKRAGQPKAALSSALAAAALAEKTNMACAPACTRIAADMSLVLGNIAGAERLYEKTLAQVSAYAPDIAHEPGFQTSWARDQGGIRKRLAALKQQLASTRPSSAWLLRDMPWLAPGQTHSKRDCQRALAGVERLEKRVRTGELHGASVHDELGTDYLILGRSTDAIVQFLASTQLGPTGDFAWRQLGSAYLAQGRLGDAANAYQAACSAGDKGSCILAQKMLESMKRYSRKMAAKHKHPAP